jgi:hypothetical protein
VLRFGQGSAADVVVFLGPVSEFLGRARVLHYSFATFFREYLASFSGRRIADLESAQLPRRIR